VLENFVKTVEGLKLTSIRIIPMGKFSLIVLIENMEME
jgi:hypothetical protein